MIECEICGRKFKNLSGLRGHQRIIHNIHINSKHNEMPSPEPLTPSTEAVPSSIIEKLLESDTSTTSSASENDEFTAQSSAESTRISHTTPVENGEMSAKSEMKSGEKTASHNVKKSKEDGQEGNENKGSIMTWLLVIAFIVLIAIQVIDYMMKREENHEMSAPTSFRKQYMIGLRRGVFP